METKKLAKKLAEDQLLQVIDKAMDAIWLLRGCGDPKEAQSPALTAKRLAGEAWEKIVYGTSDNES